MKKKSWRDRVLNKPGKEKPAVSEVLEVYVPEVDGTAVTDIETLKEELGLSEEEIRRNNTRLEELGLIKKL